MPLPNDRHAMVIAELEFAAHARQILEDIQQLLRDSDQQKFDGGTLPKLPPNIRQEIDEALDSELYWIPE